MNFKGLNFPSTYNSLNGTHPFPISTLDIARASVTVGYGVGYTPFNALWLFPFHVTHFTLPFIVLEPIADPTVLRPFLSLVPRSIRRYVTERLAMAVTKVWADKFASVPWLAEVEFLEALGVIQFDKTSKERPDLAGQDMHQDWHVFEAKGRPGSRSIATILAKAKRQASRVHSINGSPPLLTLGAVLHSQDSSFQLTLDDPPPDDDDGMNAEIREELFYAAYYQSIRGILASGETSSREYIGKRFITRKVASDGYHVSLGLVDTVERNVIEGVHFLREEPIKVADAGMHSVGKDGTALFID